MLISLLFPILILQSQWLECLCLRFLSCLGCRVQLSLIEILYSLVFFGESFFRLQGTSLNMSSSYHPQTNGQSEIVNKCLGNYLRCSTLDRPKQWSTWLPWAEYWYNTSWHSSIRMTPYEAVYGVPLPRLLTYVPGTTWVEAVEEELRTRQQILILLQHNLQQA
jgi:hypothetical protein